MDQPHHLRAIGVHGNDVWFEAGPVQRRDTNVVVCAGLESPRASLQVVAACSSLQYIPTETNPLRYHSLGLRNPKAMGASGQMTSRERTGGSMAASMRSPMVNLWFFGNFYSTAPTTLNRARIKDILKHVLITGNLSRTAQLDPPPHRSHPRSAANRPWQPPRSSHLRPQPRLNPHRARRAVVALQTDRDFVPWRFSNAGHRASVSAPYSGVENLHRSRRHMLWRNGRRRFELVRATRGGAGRRPAGSPQHHWRIKRG